MMLSPVSPRRQDLYKAALIFAAIAWLSVKQRGTNAQHANCIITQAVHAGLSLTLE